MSNVSLFEPVTLFDTLIQSDLSDIAFGDGVTVNRAGEFVCITRGACKGHLCYNWATGTFASRLSRDTYAWVRGNGLLPFSKVTINRKIARANKFAHIRERLEGLPSGSLWNTFLHRDRGPGREVEAKIVAARLRSLYWEPVPYSFNLAFDPTDSRS